MKVERSANLDFLFGSALYLISLCSKLPSWARAVTPRIFYITEKAWNYYPYTVTGKTPWCCGAPLFHSPWVWSSILFATVANRKPTSKAQRWDPSSSAISPRSPNSSWYGLWPWRLSWLTPVSGLLCGWHIQTMRLSMGKLYTFQFVSVVTCHGSVPSHSLCYPRAMFLSEICQMILTSWLWSPWHVR